MKFEDSLKNGAHHNLSLMIGKWQGTTQVWFTKDELADETETKGTIRSILEGRFIVHEYEGSFQGKPVEGVAVIGFDFSQNKIQCTWADSFHMSTGIMFSESIVNADHLNVLGSYQSSPDNPERWGWRTEIETIGKDELIITMYNISPNGDEVKAVETKYKRIRD